MKRSQIGPGLITLIAAGALTLTGCAGGGASTTGENTPVTTGGIITVNNTEPQRGLLPADTTEIGGGKIVNSLWEGLVYYDVDGATKFGVAESIESEDQINWTVKLRTDAVFSDGTPVKAHNFVDAWNYAANIDNAQGSADLFSVIKGFSSEVALPKLEGLKVVDDYTFTVEATPDFPDRLGYTAFYPLPDVAFADMAAFGQHPVGNGLYQFDGADAWKHNEEIRLVKNNAYVGPRQVKNDGITFKVYASLDAAYTDLLANNLDVLDQIPDTSFEVFQSDLGNRAILQAGSLITTITISENLARFTGEEGKLRRAALSKALNREEVIKVIFNGTNVPAKDFTSPVVDGFNENLKGNDVLKFNADEAKKLWAEADEISPFTGTLEVATNADDPHAVWVEAVANQWAENLGISTALKSYPTFAAFLADRSADAVGGPFGSGWQGNYPGAYSYLQPLYATGAGSNHGFYSNPKFDALLGEASKSADRAERNSKLDQAQEILLADLPSIPLWYQGTTGGYSTKVTGVVFGWNSVPILNEIVKK